jgi:hypothetical protein
MTLPGLVAANNLSDVVDRERAWDNLGSSVSTNIPIPLPSLDLNFAASKSLIDDISGNNLITFTRASTGTFVGSNGLIQTAASGVPRFDHNPTTGESLGLLVEEARTNLLLRSEEINNIAWSASQVPTPSANTTTAPDNTVTAETISVVVSGNNREVGQAFTSIAGTTYSFSFFVKAGTTSWCYLIFSDRTAHSNGWYFDVTNGAVGGVTGLSAGTNVTRVSSSILPAANGFWRCQVTLTVANSAIYFATVGVVAANNNAGAAAGNTIYIWGAQLEAGAFPTSYIPTVASTVTRAADVASITGANFSSWYNQGAGTLFLDVKSDQGLLSVFAIAQTAAGLDPRVLQLGNGVSADRAEAYSSGGYSLIFAGYGGLNVRMKMANAQQLNDAGFSVNGATTLTDTSFAPPSVNRLNIGFITGTSAPTRRATFSRLTYYAIRLSNLTLEYLTSASGSPSSTTYPYTFTIKGKDTLALNSVNNASTRDFVFIKGLLSAAQPRLTTAAQQVASGTVFQDAAMLKASPTTSGNYFFSSGITLSGVSTRINGTPALSIATSPFSGSTATASILLRELQPQTNWRITEPMPSGIIASPEFAIPFETNDFVLFMKAGQN